MRGLINAQTNGIDQTLNFITPPTGGQFIQWQAKAGRTYFLQISDPSDHLNKWYWYNLIERGNDQSISYDVTSTADKGFFRLHYTDQTATNLEAADFDTDGLTNLYEITPRPRPGGTGGHFGLNPNIQTNPLASDSDKDGLNDKWEEDNGLDPTDDGSREIVNGPNGDPDSDGLTNSGELALGTNPHKRRIWSFRKGPNSDGTVTYTWNSLPLNGDPFKIETQLPNGTWKTLYATTYGSNALPYVSGLVSYSLTLTPATDYLP